MCGIACLVRVSFSARYSGDAMAGAVRTIRTPVGRGFTHKVPALILSLPSPDTWPE
jgi:hypothetical protein